MGVVVYGQPTSTPCSWRFLPSCYRSPGSSSTSCQGALRQALTSGDFREVFFQRVTPTAIHLFDSRKDVFKNQTVLQENLVFTGRRRRASEAADESQVLVSHSKAAHDLASRRSRLVGLDAVLDPASENRELSIPVCKQDLELMQAVRTWPNTLRSLGLEISTGPVFHSGRRPF